MSKNYTAQEMRHRADEEQYLWNDSTTAAMLRQAADDLERVEQEKKYEYARVLSDGSISCTHFDEYVKGCYKFRRSVGEWEEIS